MKQSSQILCITVFRDQQRACKPLMLSLTIICMLACGCHYVSLYEQWYDSAAKEVKEERASFEVEDELIRAVHKNDVDLVRKLVDAGGHVDYIADNDAPLHVAAARGYYDIAVLLIEAGADVDIRQRRGWFTPLHLAVVQGHINMVHVLIDAGGAINAQGVDGTTGVYWAVRKDDFAMVELLLQNGASVEIPNHAGERLVDLASPRIRELIRRYIHHAIIVEIRGEIDDNIPAIIENALSYARERNARSLIICIDSHGGDVAPAFEASRLLLSASDIDTVAYVCGRGALSASSFIALSCKSLYMQPESVIGCALPYYTEGEHTEIQNRKLISFISSQTRGIARHRGYNELIIEAMVDPAVSIYLVVDESGDTSVYVDSEIPEKYQKKNRLVRHDTVLTLNAQEARELAISKGSIDSMENLLKLMDVNEYSY